MNEISSYKLHHVMIMAFGKVITKEDQRKIGVTVIASGRRVAYLFGRSAEAERKRLESLKLSKQMIVFEITDAQFGLFGKVGHTWSPCMSGRGVDSARDHLLLPKPTKKQWGESYHIGLNNGRKGDEVAEFPTSLFGKCEAQENLKRLVSDFPKESVAKVMEINYTIREAK